MITKELVLKIAKLAHLSVDESSVEGFSKNLSDIFGYMAQLEKVNVDDVAPMSHVLGQTNVFRADEVKPSLGIEEALKNTPDCSGRFIRVPIIVEPGTEH